MLNVCPTFHLPMNGIKQADEHPGDVNRAPDLHVPGESRQLEKLEQVQEIPIRPGGRERLGRISRRRQVCAVIPDHEKHDGCHYRKAGDRILENLIRPKEGVLFLFRLGRRDAVAAEQVNVPDDQQHDHCRQHPGVQRKEAGQRVMPVVGATYDKFLQLRPDKRHKIHEIRRDLRGPVSFLVPRQKIASQRECQHELEQDDAKPKIHLTRRLVGAVHQHLHQVQ